MTKEKNKVPLSPAEEKLAEEELEQAAGGQIELVQDGPIKAAGIKLNTGDGFRGSHQA